MAFNAWRIANDAEADEGHVVEVTNVGDGRAFHIHGQTFGEGGLNFIELGAIANELVARANESAVDGRRYGRVGRHTLCRSE